MRKDFIEIIKYMREKRLKYSITTNGYLLTPKIIDALAETNCNEIRISVHDMDGAHDKIVNVKGAFEKVLDNIELAIKKIPVLINCVITDDNIDNLKEIGEFFTRIGCTVRFQHLEFMTGKMVNNHLQYCLEKFGSNLPVKYGTTRLDAVNVEKVKKFVEENDYQYEPKLKPEEVEDYYNDEGFYPRRCFPIYGSTRIDPYGNVYPCIDYFFGNLLAWEFKDIWQGETAKRFKEIMREGLMPGCSRCCKLWM